MRIFDKLSSVDNQLKDDLNNLEEERRKEEYAQWKEEQQRKEDERNRRREAQREKIKVALEDDTEGIDEPHWYTITYEHSEGWGGGIEHGHHYKKGSGKFELLMTEREKRIAEATGKLKQYAYRNAPGTCDITRIEVSEVEHEMTAEEKLKVESIRKKVEIIKESEEAETECVIDLYDQEFETIPVNTTLKHALLSSVSIENGKVREMDKEDTKTNFPEKQKSKITFTNIKNAIVKAFNKGER